MLEDFLFLLAAPATDGSTVAALSEPEGPEHDTVLSRSGPAQPLRLVLTLRLTFLDTLGLLSMLL